MSTKVVCVPMKRLCITATGPDASSYLHSQLSNDIASLGDGESRYSFVLEPTGRVVALVRVTRLAADTFLLDTDAVDGLADTVIARLNRFKIRVTVEFGADIRECVAIRSIADGEGPADEIPAHVRTRVAALASGHLADAWWGDGRALDLVPIRSGVELSVSDVARTDATLDVPSDGCAVLEASRVHAGWPAMNAEIVPGETLAAATGVVSRAVSFTKGCYPGQELVERMDSRGSSAPRTLRRMMRQEVPVADPAQIAVGDALVVDGAEVGTVTSITENEVLAYVVRTVDLGVPVTPAD